MSEQSAVVFIYGALRDPNVRMRVCGRKIQGTRALALGVDIVYQPAGDDTVAVIRQRGVAFGELVAVSNTELNRIADWHAKDRRIAIVAQTPTAVRVPCFVYVRDGARPSVA